MWVKKEKIPDLILKIYFFLKGIFLLFYMRYKIKPRKNTVQ